MCKLTGFIMGLTILLGVTARDQRSVKCGWLMPVRNPGW